MSADHFIFKLMAQATEPKCKDNQRQAKIIGQIPVSRIKAGAPLSFSPVRPREAPLFKAGQEGAAQGEP
jgi:hypothetical protein